MSPATLSPPPTLEAPPIAPVYTWSWTGFYIGAHGGAGWAKNTWSDFFDPINQFGIPGPNASYDSDAYRATLQDAANKPGKVVRNDGDFAAAAATGMKTAGIARPDEGGIKGKGVSVPTFKVDIAAKDLNDLNAQLIA